MVTCFTYGWVSDCFRRGKRSRPLGRTTRRQNFTRGEPRKHHGTYVAIVEGRVQKMGSIIGSP